MSRPDGFGDGRLVAFVEEAIWTVSTPVRFVGTWFPHVMTIVRLNDAELLLHSPCAPSSELLSQIEKLGRVAHVVAPNWFHDLYLSEYRASYPDATFWGPAFLKRRHASLIDCVLNEEARPPWFDDMPHVALSGTLTFDESVFFHRATRTLIVADLLMNASAGRRAPLLTRSGYWFAGLDGSLQVFTILRWFGWLCRTSVRRAARAMLAWSPERIIVGHGVPIECNAIEQLQAAVRWLQP